MRKKVRKMKQGLLDYIAACEKNIVMYKEMGDEKAVKAAEGMIAEFKKILETL